MIDRSPVASPDSSRPAAAPATRAAPQLSRGSRAAWIGSLIAYLIWLVLLSWLAWLARS